MHSTVERHYSWGYVAEKCYEMSGHCLKKRIFFFNMVSGCGRAIAHNKGNSRAEGESRQKGKQGMGVTMRGKGEHNGWTTWIHKQNCVWPVCDLCQGLRRGKRLLSVRMRCHGRDWSHQQRDREDFPESHWDHWWRLEIIWGREHSLPWGTPSLKGFLWEAHVDYERGGNRSSKNGVGFGFHRQRVWRARQDARLYQKPEICRERDSPDILSDIEGLHHCWDSQKQHVQGRVTTSES